MWNTHGMKQIITVAASLIIATGLMLTLLAARAVAADDRPTAIETDCATKYGEADPEREADYLRCVQQAQARVAPRFKPWQRIWQCNDIRVTETVTQPGIGNYDLSGTIWGGSQFTFDIQRGNLYFNGRPCLPLQR
jgi:hypothetical protein